MGAAAYDDVPTSGGRPRRPALRLVPELGLDLVPELVPDLGPTLVPSSGDAQGTRAPLRLSGSGRLAIVLVVAALAVLLVCGLARASAPGPAGSRVVTVQAGQTLSHIAARELPDLPIGTAVAEIQLANQLNTGHVHAGQQLVIPDIG